MNTKAPVTVDDGDTADTRSTRIQLGEAIPHNDDFIDRLELARKNKSAFFVRLFLHRSGSFKIL